MQIKVKENLEKYNFNYCSFEGGGEWKILLDHEYVDFFHFCDKYLRYQDI